jgi:uncharacterized SAM-binding protein YcdF (DUF218 family)
MSCFRKCLITIAGMALVVGAALAIVVLTAGNWLIQPDRPVRADAIVALSGDLLRTVYAAELYRAGFAPRVILTEERRMPAHRKLDELGIPFPEMHEVSREILLKFGVPRDAIQVIGQRVISTAAESAAVRAALPPESSILVVTSWYHTRRTHMTFARHFPSGKLAVVSDPTDGPPSPWWSEQDSARAVILELVKIPFFLAGGRY